MDIIKLNNETIREKIKNEDFYDEYIDLDDDERIDQYTDTTADNFERWLGNLTDAQESAIEKAMPALLSSAALRLEQRRVWQSNIQQILESTDSKQIKTERLRQFFGRFNMNDQPQLAAALDNNKKVFAQLTVDIVNQATAEQKTFFINKTNEYIQAFTELAENR